jgi:tRNA G37 N-methylase Trm5
MADSKEAAPKAKKEKKKEDGGEQVHVHNSHREKTKSKWTFDRCKKFASRFKTEMEWAAGAPASYKSAQAHGWVTQCMGGTKSVRKAG